MQAGSAFDGIGIPFETGNGSAEGAMRRPRGLRLPDAVADPYRIMLSDAVAATGCSTDPSMPQRRRIRARMAALAGR